MENSRQEAFSALVGKVVQEVDASCINEVLIMFTDGTTAILNCDEQAYGIGIIQVEVV